MTTLDFSATANAPLAQYQAATLSEDATVGLHLASGSLDGKVIVHSLAVNHTWTTKVRETTALNHDLHIRLLESTSVVCVAYGGHLLINRRRQIRMWNVPGWYRRGSWRAVEMMVRSPYYAARSRVNGQKSNG